MRTSDQIIIYIHAFNLKHSGEYRRRFKEKVSDFEKKRKQTEKLLNTWSSTPGTHTI